MQMRTTIAVPLITVWENINRRLQTRQKLFNLIQIKRRLIIFADFAIKRQEIMQKRKPTSKKQKNWATTADNDKKLSSDEKLAAEDFFCYHVKNF